MIDMKFLEEQVGAKPFVPFTLILVTGERYQIRSKAHIALPPLDEVSRRPTWFIAYNQRSIPRYFALESIISIEQD
jgi:hypothetical protein